MVDCREAAPPASRIAPSGLRGGTEAPPAYRFDSRLSIPERASAGGAYLLSVVVSGFRGWALAFEASRLDSSGNAIALPSTRIETNDQVLGTASLFDPGFEATLTIYLQNPDKLPVAPGANVQISCILHAASPGQGATIAPPKSIPVGEVVWRTSAEEVVLVKTGFPA